MIYTYRPSLFGTLRFALSERLGISAIDLLHPNLAPLLNHVRDDDNPILNLYAAEIQRYIERKISTVSGVEWDIPDHSETDTRILSALHKIPFGETRSYSDVAKMTGCHHRTVARACGKNVLALYIPCHRVIMKNGDLGGYKWGTRLKSDALKQEADMYVY